MTPTERIAGLKAAAKERILILDGSWGVMIKRRGLADAVARATEREYEEQAWLRDTADFKEGTKAMGERRPPNFQAR